MHLYVDATIEQLWDMDFQSVERIVALVSDIDEQEEITRPIFTQKTIEDEVEGFATR